MKHYLIKIIEEGTIHNRCFTKRNAHMELWVYLQNVHVIHMYRCIQGQSEEIINIHLWVKWQNREYILYANCTLYFRRSNGGDSERRANWRGQ